MMGEWATSEPIERMATPPRAQMLRDAAKTVMERGFDYGPPEAHFARTVALLNVVLAHKLREPLTVTDWPVVMICDKLARDVHRPKVDNCVDVAGYAACLFEIREGQQ